MILEKWTNDGMGTDYNLDAPSINQQLVNYNAITRKWTIVAKRKRKQSSLSKYNV
jgi:hypothetical protein